MKQSAIVFERSITKGKRRTREVPITPPLRAALEAWRKAQRSKKPASDAYVFPGRGGRSTVSRQTADRVLRRAYGVVGVDGASTHSWRRTSLTSASNQGIPLRHLQRLSGHASLDMLSRYLDVTDAQLRAAALAFLQ